MKRISVRVCGCDYEIKYSDPGAWSAGAMGRTNVFKGEILIKDTLEADQSVATQIHEIVHLMLDATGHQSASGDEVFVSALSSSLTAFLRDNPERLAAWRETWEMGI
jgi:hypothetical protein